MKRFNTIVPLLVVLLIFTLVSCSPVQITGLKQWNFTDSSTSLTKYLFPDEDFLSCFEYLDGDYHYFDNCKPWDHLEVAIAFTEYEDEVYLKAKQYCFDNMLLSEYNRIEYNGYVFVETLELPRDYKHLEDGKNTNYPYHMNMFAYNDSLNRLVFLGFYCSVEGEDKADIIKTDFGAFLETYYSEYYDFGTSIN